MMMPMMMNMQKMMDLSMMPNASMESAMPMKG